ncbi:MAG: HAMP domain-containing sensor histidine kinase [Rudaea sp.]
MKPLRPQLRGLIFKLTVFYVLLSLPCLILVETGILVFEFNRFMANVDRGALSRATQQAADDLARAWPRDTDAVPYLATWSQALILRLQRPHGGLLEQESYILVELSADPLAAAVLAPDGRLLAQAPVSADWHLRLPQAGAVELRSALAQSTPHLINVADNPYRVRRTLAPVRASDGTLRGFLLVELRLPVPWHRFLLDASLEWPIVLGYLIVFGIASSFFLAAWVTRRLNRVARAATAWSRGDFSDRINDASRDELGRLSALLDDMALQLKGLLRSRAQLATLAERQRLARDLHDTVKQQAFALTLQLAAIHRELGSHPSNERIAQTERISRQMQQDLAHILDELRTPDADLPFVERLRARTREWAQTSGLPLELDLAPLPPLSAAHEQALLRVTDEALANVLRHSGASHARLSLHRDEHAATLQIADNGRGAGDEARPGMGIGNMRERAQSLPDGQFVFTSDAEHGTRVRVTFSINGNLPA